MKPDTEAGPGREDWIKVTPREQEGWLGECPICGVGRIESLIEIDGKYVCYVHFAACKECKLVLIAKLVESNKTEVRRYE